MEKLTLLRVDNPFDKRERTVFKMDYDKGKSLKDVVDSVGSNAKYDYSLYLNGKKIKFEQYPNIYLCSGDNLVLVPNVHGGGGSGNGKMVLRIVATIIISAVSYGAGGLAAGGSWGAAGWGAAGASSTAGMIAATAVNIVGGLLLNLMSPSAKASQVDSGQNFGWEPVLTQMQGIPINKWYGTNQISNGNIISGYIEQEGTNNILNLLVSYGLGPWAKLTSVYLNEQEYSNITGVTVESRLGQLTQQVISNFNVTKIEIANNILLPYNTPVEYTTTNSKFDFIEFDVIAPDGFFVVSDKGVVSSLICNFRIELYNGSSWDIVDPYYTSDAVTEETEGHLSFGDWKRGEPIYSGDTITGMTEDVWLEIENLGTDREAFKEGGTGELIRFDLVGVGYIWIKPRVQWIPIGTNIVQINASTVENVTDVNIFLIGNTYLPAKKSRKFNVANASGSTKTFRITRLTEEISAGDKNVYLSTVRECVDDDFSYPRNVLLSARGLASEQISNNLSFKAKADCSLVKVYINGVWVTKFSKNPAWVSWDILTQPVFEDFGIVFGSDGNKYRCKLTHDSTEATAPGTGGSWATYWELLSDSIYPYDVESHVVGREYKIATFVLNDGTHSYLNFPVSRYDGFDPSKLDLPKWVEWAEYCDDLVDDGNGGTETRLEFNGGFDNQTTVGDAVLQVFEAGRAAPVWNGVYLTVAIDKASSPVQLFNVGNIGLDKFSEVFIAKSDRASVIEADFVNQSKNYEKDRIAVVNRATGYSGNKISIELPGCTRPSEAWRRSYFKLKQTELTPRLVTLSVDIDSIACTIGDVVLIQHDVPMWGEGGRIVSATSSSVTLDKIVTFDALKTYAVTVRLKTDVIITKLLSGISHANGQSTITFATPFDDVPEQYDLYVYGESEILTKPMRLVNIRKTSDESASLTLVDYNETLYNLDDGGPVTQTPNYTPIPEVPLVTGLSVHEIRYLGETNEIIRKLQVGFNKPTSEVYKEAIIYYRVLNAQRWIKWETTQGTSSIIDGVLPATTYQICVVSKATYGVESTFQKSPKVEITTTDSTDALIPELTDGVTGLRVVGGGTTFYGLDCNVEWDDIEDVWAPKIWLKHYLVTITNIDDSARSNYITMDNWFNYTYQFNSNDVLERTFKVTVQAIGVDGTISPPATIAVDNPQAGPVEGLVGLPFFKGAQISWLLSPDIDLFGYEVHASQTSGFTPSEETLVMTVPTGGDSCSIPNLENGLWYIKVGAFDAFGKDDIQYSSTTVNVLGTIEVTDVRDFSEEITKKFGVPVLEFDTWSGNAVDSLTWNSHDLYYAGIKYVIDSPGGGTTTNKYVYWDVANPETYQVTDSDAVIDALVTEDGQFLIAVNRDGNFVLAWNAKANQVIGSAYIDVAAINTVHVGTIDGSIANLINITASKIIVDSVAVDAGKLAARDSATFNQTGTPTTAVEGDTWYSSTTTLIRRYNGLLPMSSLTNWPVVGSYGAPSGSNVGGIPADYIVGWSHSSDRTTIDGGKIYTNTIVTTALKAVSRGLFPQVHIYANHPTVNKLYWESGVIGYINDAGAWVTQVVSANAAGTLWSSGVIYLYWTVGNANLTTSTIAPVPSSNQILLATYTGGTSLNIISGTTDINGSWIRTGTVDASIVNVTNLNASYIISGIITGIQVRTNYGTAGYYERIELNHPSYPNKVSIFDSSNVLIGSFGASTTVGSSLCNIGKLDGSTTSTLLSLRCTPSAATNAINIIAYGTGRGSIINVASGGNRSFYGSGSNLFASAGTDDGRSMMFVQNTGGTTSNVTPYGKAIEAQCASGIGFSALGAYNKFGAKLGGSGTYGGNAIFEPSSSASGPSHDAPVGTLVCRTLTGTGVTWFYLKKLPGAGAGNWGLIQMT